MGVIDIDAHHGNGTAAIFYDRGDVLYGSVHVDPGAGWFPHVVGFADEIGHRRGRRAPPGTCRSRRGHRRRRLARGRPRAGRLGRRRAGCTALVVSLGVDAAADDPESPLLVTRDGLPRGRRARSVRLGLPAVVVQEGGYHLPTLGGLVAAYLDGHTSTLRGG